MGLSNGHLVICPVSTLPSPMPDHAHPTQPAWSKTDLASDPHARDDKHDRVRTMFAAISKSYDLNNRLHSLGLDQSWRNFAVRHANLKPTDHVLDAACGTGDLTRLLAKGTAGITPAKVIGLDFTPQMLDIARTKRARPTDQGIDYIQGDAMNLPFPDNSFDVLSIAFGLRNVQSPQQAVKEFFRVLRPAGRLIVLEFDRPRNPLVRWANDLYTKHIMPTTATLISRDKSGAYKYLPTSVATFLDRDQLTQLFCSTGFTQAQHWPLTLGTCICHRAIKP